MSQILVKNYQSKLSIKETQEAIVKIKDYFLSNFSNNLGLTRVSAPMFVNPITGLNDNLSGKEKAVSFNVKDGTNLEIVHSLAKWKRYALKEYSLAGLIADMNAIRKDEELDNIHSIYVDQWDWEKVLSLEERNISYLKDIVNKIYKSILETEKYINNLYPILKNKLANEVYFITSEELLKKYPNLSSKERENAIIKEHHTVFVIGIGNKLSNGESHDSRAADYDDWNLNGDLLVYDEVLDIALELTSMGIRVNKDSLSKQLKIKGENPNSNYHNLVLNDELPFTIGGGIGQSRLSMFLLEKAHIGEVQSSYWPDNDIKTFNNLNVHFL